MLKNRWIITKKKPIKNCPGRFNYTIIPVDNWAGQEDFDIWNKCIFSKRDLDVGTYTDDELKPLCEHYKYLNTDIATVEYASIKAFNPNLMRLNVFGDRFGEFSFLVESKNLTFRITRGDNILVQRNYDMTDFSWPQEDKDDEDEYDDPILQDILGPHSEKQKKHEPEEKVGPYFRILYNLTTKRKSVNFPKTKRSHAKSNFGDCNKVVVLGISPIDLDYDTQKHLFIRSDKFGLLSCLIDEYQSEFQTYTNDKVLVQQYYDYNIGEIAYRILANNTVDNMRAFIVKQNVKTHHR